MYRAVGSEVTARFRRGTGHITRSNAKSERIQVLVIYAVATSAGALSFFSTTDV